MIHEKESTGRTTQQVPAFPSSNDSVLPLEVEIGGRPPEVDIGGERTQVDIGEPSHTPQGGRPCTLYLDFLHRCIVADGLVYLEQTIHHNNPIPQDQRRVTVTSV